MLPTLLENPESCLGLPSAHLTGRVLCGAGELPGASRAVEPSSLLQMCADVFAYRHDLHTNTYNLPTKIHTDQYTVTHKHSILISTHKITYKQVYVKTDTNQENRQMEKPFFEEGNLIFRISKQLLKGSLQRNENCFGSILVGGGEAITNRVPCTMQCPGLGNILALFFEHRR